MESPVNGQQRGSIRIGLVVDIIQKEDQRSGKKTRGIVQEILTNSLSHPHGIKVRLKGGKVGRVTGLSVRYLQKILYRLFTAFRADI